MKNIFFPKERIEFIKSCKDERCKELLKKVLSDADNILKQRALDEESVQVNGEGLILQHENYGNAARPFSSYMPVLTFAYEYTNDEKYFLKAKDFMLKYCSYSRWHGKGSNGKGELNTGHFLTGMSYGWAAFSDKFTPEEKKFISDRIYTLGILPQFEDWVFPETKIHCFDTMGHNWWPVCVSSGALAAITLSEYLPQGLSLAKKAAEGLREWFDYKGNPINMKPQTLDNGAFYETVGYYNYALYEYLRFAEAFIAVTGEAPFDDEEILKKSAEFFVNTFYPSDKDDYIIGFGDSDGVLFSSSVPFILKRCPETGILRYYVKNRKTAAATDTLHKLVYFEEVYLLPDTIPESLSVCYEKIGWAIFRDSFKENSSLLAVKCGDSWNHSHCDATHFIFYRNGIPEIFDSHCCSYGNEIYRDYYVQSKAHNVVLFNGNGQCHDDHHHHVRPKGMLYNFTDENGFRYVCADASGPMGRYFRKHLRHFIWADDIIIIYDSIWAYEKGEMNFLLHCEDNTCFRMLSPCDKRTENGYIGKDITETTFLSFNRETDDYGRGDFVSALCLDESKEPIFEEIADGYKITYGNKKIYINVLSDGRVMHRNCFNTFDGITTDAVVLIDNDGKYAVVNASSVRKDNKSILDVYARINGNIN